MRSSVASKPSLDKLTGPVETLSGGLHRVSPVGPDRPGLAPGKICEILNGRGREVPEGPKPSLHPGWPEPEERYRKAGRLPVPSLRPWREGFSPLT